MIKKLSIKSFIFLSVFSGVLTADSYKFGVGSCLDQDFPQPIWNQIEEEDLNYFIFLGDNVYGDVPSGSLWKLPRAYKKQKKLFPDFLSEIEKFAIWDDHDYGKNDGGTEYPLKNEAQKLFLDFWDVKKDDPRRNREGIYFSEKLKIGDLKVNLIGLDTRYHRSPLDQTDKPYYPTQDKSKTILGAAQWQWLENELKKESDLIILVSSIQVIPTEHIFEKWHNFPHERIRLLKALNNAKGNVIILSGDRHKAGLYKTGNIVEMTSSSMNKPISRPIAKLWDIFLKEKDEFLIGEMYSRENYGILSIDKEKIVLNLKDIDGNTIISEEI